jgi:hypothetical protein
MLGLMFSWNAHQAEEKRPEFQEFRGILHQQGGEREKPRGGGGLLVGLGFIKLGHVVDGPKLIEPLLLGRLVAFLSLTQTIPNVGRIFAAFDFDGDDFSLMLGGKPFCDGDVRVGREGDHDLSM